MILTVSRSGREDQLGGNAWKLLVWVELWMQY